MKLHRLGRRLYVVGITTNPVVTGTWKASVDEGATYHNGTQLSDGTWSWLVAGPDNTGGTPDFTTPAGQATVVPLLRLDVGTEQIVLNGPPINVDLS